MSKQIYIDSNGNEVLVSGTIINDNNLPHYTGTPTAGTTAEAIGTKGTLVNLGSVNTTTKTLTFTNNVRFVLYTNGASTSRMGEYMCYGRTTTTFFQPVLTSSVTTLTTEMAKIKITTTADNVFCYMLLLEGTTDDFSFA